MKKLENKTIENLKLTPNSEDLSYSELGMLIVRLNEIKKKGALTTDLMRKHNRLVEVFEKVKKNESFEMEDADFDYFKSLVLSTDNYPISHMGFVEFEDYIKTIK